MKPLAAALAAVIVVCLMGPSAAAHQVTFKGTVVSTEKTAIEVAVVDEKTKKPVQMTFDVDKDTKILRGDQVLTLAEAKIQRNEKIAVTVDHDNDETLALIVRFDEKK